jgi:hypothetical protein
VIHVLTTVTLHKDPKRRLPRAGSPTRAFSFALAKAKLFVNVRAFGDEATALLALTKGDAAAIQGKADIGVYEAKDGQHKPSI